MNIAAPITIAQTQITAPINTGIKGAKGDKGDPGASVINGYFAEADLIFEKDDNSQIVIANGFDLLKGEPGVSPTLDDATTTTKGIIQIATAAEVAALSDTGKAVTPGDLSDVLFASGISPHVWRMYGVASAGFNRSVTGGGGGFSSLGYVIFNCTGTTSASTVNFVKLINNINFTLFHKGKRNNGVDSIPFNRKLYVVIPIYFKVFFDAPGQANNALSYFKLHDFEFFIYSNKEWEASAGAASNSGVITANNDDTLTLVVTYLNGVGSVYLLSEYSTNLTAPLFTWVCPTTMTDATTQLSFGLEKDSGDAAVEITGLSLTTLSLP
jgi:hypothetical protein